MAVYTETIELKDNVSGAAGKAAKQVSVLEGAIIATENALLKAQATGNVKKYNALSKELASYKSALEVLPKSVDTASASEDKLSKSTFDAANAMAIGKETIQGAITGIKNAFASLAQGDVKGVISGLTESVASMAKMLDLVVPGLGQVASTVITIVGGLAAGLGALVQQGMAFAIEASESKQAMLGLFDAMGQGQVTGAQTEEMIDGLKAKFGIAKDSLIQYTNALHAMGRTDLSEVEASLHAAASAGALVKGGDQAFLSMTKKLETFIQTGQGLKLPIKGLGSLAEMGLNVDDVAKRMGVSTAELTNQLKNGTANAMKFGEAMQDALIEKGAGPLARMASSWGNLKKMLSESIGDLFEDIDVGPFMTEVKELFSIFSQAKPSGQALKSGIGSFFQKMFDIGKKVIPMIKHFMLNLVIWGLKAYIAVKPIVKAFNEWRQSEAGIKIISFALDSMLNILKTVGAIIAVVITLAAASAAAFIAVSVAVHTVIGAIQSAIDYALTAFVDFIASAPQLAMDFISGLVSGITGGASAVKQSVVNMAEGAKNAFKDVLGIHSPSKVGIELGRNFGESTGSGIEQASSATYSASANLAGSAAGGFMGGGTEIPAGNSASGAQVVVYVEPGAIVIQGAGGNVQDLTEQAVSLIFERVALARGL